MAYAITLHLFAAVIWVGGMFFAYVALRPVAAQLLDPPIRLPLWQQVFQRFFKWVWASVIVLPATGYWMVFFVFDGFGHTAVYIHLMHLLGIIMIAIFVFIYFKPYQGLKTNIDIKAFPEAAKHLNVIRRLIAINLTLGISTIGIASLGRYFS
jgi:uncharacterized membrane protein